VGGNIGEEGLEEDVFSVDGGGGEVIPTGSDDPVSRDAAVAAAATLSNVPRTSMLLDDIDPSGLWGCGGVVGGVVKGVDGVIDSSSDAGLEFESSDATLSPFRTDAALAGLEVDLDS